MTKTDQQCPELHVTGKICVACDSDRDQLLDQLRDAGERRATANRQTLAGLTQLKQAYEDIRVYSAEARRLGMSWPRIGAAVGVSRTQLHNIVTGKTSV